MLVCPLATKISNKITNVSKRLAHKTFNAVNKTIHGVCGTYSTSKIIDTAQKIGRDVLDIRCKKTILTNDDILKIIETNLGKKYIDKVKITNNSDDVIEIMQKRYGLSSSRSYDILENCTAMVLPKNFKNEKTILYIPQSKLIAASPDDISIIAHELEHITYCEKSLYSKLPFFSDKTCKKSFKNLINYTELNDKIYMYTINDENKKIAQSIINLDFRTLIKLLMNAKDELRAFTTEENLYNHIQKKYSFINNTDRILYSYNFRKTVNTIANQIREQYLRFLPKSIANKLLDIIN